MSPGCSWTHWENLWMTVACLHRCLYLVLILVVTAPVPYPQSTQRRSTRYLRGIAGNSRIRCWNGHSELHRGGLVCRFLFLLVEISNLTSKNCARGQSFGRHVKIFEIILSTGLLNSPPTLETAWSNLKFHSIFQSTEMVQRHFSNISWYMQACLNTTI